MVVSLLRIVRHTYRPHSGVLVADANGTWKLLPVAPHLVTEPGLVLYRFGAELFYANAARFLEEVSCVIQPLPTMTRWVVVDAEAMTHVDYTASRVVMALKKNLDEAGIELAFARMPWDLRSDFNRHHLTETIGPSRIFNRLHDAIAAFEESLKLSVNKTNSDGTDGISVDSPDNQ
jgi:MFS superfamily sulfate permease-like transporter